MVVPGTKAWNDFAESAMSPFRDPVAAGRCERLSRKRPVPDNCNPFRQPGSLVAAADHRRGKGRDRQPAHHIRTDRPDMPACTHAARSPDSAQIQDIHRVVGSTIDCADGIRIRRFHTQNFLASSCIQVTLADSQACPRGHACKKATIRQRQYWHSIAVIQPPGPTARRLATEAGVVRKFFISDSAMVRFLDIGVDGSTHRALCASDARKAVLEVSAWGSKKHCWLPLGARCLDGKRGTRLLRLRAWLSSGRIGTRVVIQHASSADVDCWRTGICAQLEALARDRIARHLAAKPRSNNSGRPDALASCLAPGADDISTPKNHRSEWNSRIEDDKPMRTSGG